MYNVLDAVLDVLQYDVINLVAGPGGGTDGKLKVAVCDKSTGKPAGKPADKSVGQSDSALENAAKIRWRRKYLNARNDDCPADDSTTDDCTETECECCACACTCACRCADPCEYCCSDSPPAAAQRWSVHRINRCAIPKPLRAEASSKPCNCHLLWCANSFSPSSCGGEIAYDDLLDCINAHCRATLGADTKCVETRAIDLWRNLCEQAFTWVALADEPPSEQPFQNFQRVYGEAQKRSFGGAATSDKTSKAASLRMWQRLTRIQRLPYVMEAFMCKVRAGQVNMWNQKEAHKVLTQLLIC